MIKKTFTTGVDGEKSSKRVGFIITLTVAIISSIAALVMALKDGQYEDAIIIINSIWWACFGFGGLVASEVIGKFAKNDKQ